MDVLYPRCAGLDVHKKTVVACRVLPGPQGQPHKEIQTFGTMTCELLHLTDWLIEGGVTHVAMESTGVYWKPLYNLLEGSFTLLLVNAAHVKAVPGRKTDVKDSEWLADLLRHGLLKASFVPERAQRELRELVRYRTALVRERAAELNRVQKTLEGANIKLASVASDVGGVSGRRILAALIAGEAEAAALAELAKGRLRAKLPALEEALEGQFGAHQRFLVARQLAHLDALEATIQELGEEIRRRLAAMPPPVPPRPSQRPAAPAPDPPAASEPGIVAVPDRAGAAAAPSGFAAAVQRLVTIPGVGPLTAEKLVTEIGTDMGRFPSAGHLASWAGVCPGLHESAGKRRSGKTRKGSRWLREALLEAAHAAGRSKGTYLGAQYRRLVARRGVKKAAVAVGHTILVVAYHLIKNQTTYQEPGEQYYDERDRDAVQRRLVQRLEKLGCKVTIEPPKAA
jgi:transposase